MLYLFYIYLLQKLGKEPVLSKIIRDTPNDHPSKRLLTFSGCVGNIYTWFMFWLDSR